VINECIIYYDEELMIYTIVLTYTQSVITLLKDTLMINKQ